MLLVQQLQCQTLPWLMVVEAEEVKHHSLVSLVRKEHLRRRFQFATVLLVAFLPGVVELGDRPDHFALVGSLQRMQLRTDWTVLGFVALVVDPT